jgi:hypothetical protein
MKTTGPTEPPRTARVGPRYCFSLLAASGRKAMKIIVSALLSAVASLIATGSPLAQSTPPAESGAPAIPQRNCVLKTLNSCKGNGSCTPLDNLRGEKLPVKLTVDFEAGIVAGVDSKGWVNATRIGMLARTTDQLILQGVDSAVAWQMLIYDKSGVMSLSLATADRAELGFGDCAVAKEP